MKRFIYCAGVDYEFVGLGFDQIARHRAASRLQGVAPGEDVGTIIFDIRAGTKTTREIMWSKGKKIETSSQKKTHGEVTAKDYDRKIVEMGGRRQISSRFRGGRPDIMSITDIYAFIRDVGKKEPGSLMELSFMSHGWQGGPILVNSLDRMPNANASPEGVGLRDPEDKDPRPDKDFMKLGKSERRTLSGAFGRGAIVWQWGCNFPDVVNVVLNKLSKSGISSGMSDSILVSALTKDEIEAFSVVRNALHLSEADLKKLKGFVVERDRVRELLWTCLQSTFPYILWKSLGVDAIGALVGTYAEKMGQEMRVASISRFNTQVYQKLFNLRFDPEKKGYVFYNDSMLPADL